MTALFHTISHGMHRYFSTKLQMLKLCCCFATRCQHHMSGVALVPSEADPAGKKLFILYCMLRRGGQDFSKFPKLMHHFKIPVLQYSLGMSASDE